MGSLYAIFALLLVAVCVVHCQETSDEDSLEVLDIDQPSTHFGNSKKIYDYWKKKDKFVCPSIYGKYAHPKECSLYYECRFSVPHLIQCSRGKLYDEKKEKCRDKKHVTCHKSGKDNDDSKSDESEEEEDLVFKCPYIWGSYAHPIDCSKYFVCVYNVATLFKCHGSDLYDERIKKCLNKKAVSCGKRLDRDQMKTSRKPTTNRPTTPLENRFTTTEDDSIENDKDQVFKCPRKYGSFAHPVDCSKHFLCVDNKPTLHQCHGSDLYDEVIKKCLNKRAVNCGKRLDRDQMKTSRRPATRRPTTPMDDRSSSEESSEEDKDHVFKCPQKYGSFPHPVDCSKYFVCIDKKPSLRQCHGSDLYDEKIKKCLNKRVVKCGKRLDRDQMRTSRKPTTMRPTTPVQDRLTTTEIITTTTEMIITTTEDDNRFSCPFPDGRFVDPSDCSQFYECFLSIPTLHKCPPSTLYDERKEQCLEDKKVKCGDRPGGVHEDDEEEKEKEKKEEFHCPYVWGLFPHPDDCSKYIICIYNVPTVFNCRKTELFHAFYRRCFPSDQVTCDYRINPDDLVPPARSTTPLTTTPLITTTTAKTTTTTTAVPTTTPTTTTTTPVPTTIPTTTTTTPVPTTTTTTPVPTTTTTTPVPTTTTTTPVPTTTTTTPIPTTTTTTPVPTTTTTTPVPTTTTTTPAPTTTTTTPAPTTTTTTPKPTTTTTTPAPTTTTTTPAPTTTTTTPAPTTTTTTPAPTTTTTTPVPTTTTTTPVPTTTTTTPKPTTITIPTTTTTIRPTTKKPNTPPPTDCDEDDVDCILDETGDVKKWFDCPQRYGHFPHGGSYQLFIHCDNWRPFIKKCADGTVFSPKYFVCMWLERPIGKS